MGGFWDGLRAKSEDVRLLVFGGSRRNPKSAAGVFRGDRCVRIGRSAVGEKRVDGDWLTGLI